MTKNISVTVFNPAGLSDEERARLDGLLDALDAAVADRKTYLNTGRAKALKEFLKDPCANVITHDYLPALNAVPEDRWPAVVEEVAKDLAGMPSAANAIAQLKILGAPKQQEAVSFMVSQYVRFVDKSKERGHWQKVDGLYETILSEFSDILFNEDDIHGAVKLGEILGKEKASLTEVWKKATGAEKIEKAKSLLARAYPNDDTAHLHIAPVETKKIIAAFNTVLSADTMVCGRMFLNGTSYAFPVYMFAHEFQHRRQLRLVDSLERNQLSKGSAEYYQARLFRANFEGGYLTPMTAPNKVAMYAKLTDYFEQPVEQQANDNAKLSSSIGNTGGDEIWSLSEKFSKAVSATVRPVDKIGHEISIAVSAITSIGRRKPDGP